MAFKGKSTIELRNAETGELEQIVKDENMVTNAVSNLVNGASFFSKFSDTPIKTREIFNPLLKNAFSGLLLFEKNITEDVNIMMMPSDNKNIGHAWGAYAGSDAFTGVLNAAESKEINGGKGYRYVWDFPTDRANGTIRCASLTSGAGGICGYCQEKIDGTGVSYLGDITNLSGEKGHLISHNATFLCSTGEAGYKILGIFKDDEITLCKAKTGSMTVTFRKRKLEKTLSLHSNYIYTNQDKLVSTTKKLTCGSYFQQVDDKIYSIYPYDKNKIDIVIFDGETFEKLKEETLVFTGSVKKSL